MSEIGVIGMFTLHSLRATCATRMYIHGLDEQRIKEITEHTSIAVRSYKRTSLDQQMESSFILQNINVDSQIQLPLDIVVKDSNAVTNDNCKLTIDSSGPQKTCKKLRLECGELKINLEF